jgi:hypothetical protein
MLLLLSEAVISRPSRARRDGVAALEPDAFGGAGEEGR